MVAAHSVFPCADGDGSPKSLQAWRQGSLLKDVFRYLILSFRDWEPRSRIRFRNGNSIWVHHEREDVARIRHTYSPSSFILRNNQAR